MKPKVKVMSDHEDSAVMLPKPFFDEFAEKFSGKVAFNGEPPRLAFDTIQHQWIVNWPKGEKVFDHNLTVARNSRMSEITSANHSH